MTDEIRNQRAKFSQERLAELQHSLSAYGTFADLPDLTVFAAGSYGRMEAGPHSDIDLFFMYGLDAKSRNDNARETRFFRQLRKVAKDMEFPDFTDNGRYLVTHRTNEVLRRLGGRKDDYGNHFTARMLMLLESAPVTRSDVFDRIVKTVVAEYSRDMPGHEETFYPLFLINDVRRFWTTLLINYENSRNEAVKRDKRAAHRVKNYKLRISRLTTCLQLSRLSKASTPSTIKDWPISCRGPREAALMSSTRTYPEPGMRSRRCLTFTITSLS